MEKTQGPALLLESARPIGLHSFSYSCSFSSPALREKEKDEDIDKEDWSPGYSYISPRATNLAKAASVLASRISPLAIIARNSAGENARHSVIASLAS